jgi:integrase
LKRPIRATNSQQDIGRAMAVAREMGPFFFAVFTTGYDFGQRATAVGIWRLADIDLDQGIAWPTHQKGGRLSEPLPILDGCAEAWPAWLRVRQQYVTRPEMQDMLFPTRGRGWCYGCTGKGQVSKRRRGKDGSAAPGRPRKVACGLCGGTGRFWGMNRWEVYTTISTILKAARCRFTWPHTLRHSLAAHLLGAGIDPLAVQERLGHRSLASTLRYGSVTPQARAKIQGALSGVYASLQRRPTI